MTISTTYPGVYVQEIPESPESPLTGPNIGNRPEIGVAQIVDIPVIIVPDGMSHVLPPALQTGSPLLHGPFGHILREHI